MKPHNTKAKTDALDLLTKVAFGLHDAIAELERGSNVYAVTTALTALRKANITIGHLALHLTHCTVMRGDFPGYVGLENAVIVAPGPAPEPYLFCDYAECREKRGSCGYCLEHCPARGTEPQGYHHGPWKGEKHDTN